MDSILRGLAVYVFILLIFRFAGNRLLAQMTSFDLVLLLIISETTQEAMVDGDHSLTNCFLLIVTLVSATVLLSFLKMKFPKLDRWMDDAPLIIVDHGKMNVEFMRKVHVDKGDIMESARLLHGLERLDQIKYAIVERCGNISIIPFTAQK